MDSSYNISAGSNRGARRDAYFRFAKRKVLITLILFAGIVVPTFLLYLGEGAKKDIKSPETTQSVPSP